MQLLLDGGIYSRTDSNSIGGMKEKEEYVRKNAYKEGGIYKRKYGGS